MFASQVLARISLHEAEFKRVLNDIVSLFSNDRRLLETRGSFIIRRLCVLLNAKSIYISLSSVLQKTSDLEFASIMVQTLNLILLTAQEVSRWKRTPPPALILLNCCSFLLGVDRSSWGACAAFSRQVFKRTGVRRAETCSQTSSTAGVTIPWPR